MTTGHAAEDANVPDDQPANSEQPPAASAGNKKPRSPVERAIVWGVILLLAGVVAFEFWTKFAFTSDFDAVLAAIERSDGGQDYVTESHVKQMVTRFSGHESQPELEPNNIAANRLDTYTYSGFLKPRVLYIYYGVDRPGGKTEVLRATTELVGFLKKVYVEDIVPPEERGG